MSTTVRPPGVHDDDEQRLAELGYKQDLKRGWGMQEHVLPYSLVCRVNRWCCRPGLERLWFRVGRGTAAHPRVGRRYAP